MSKLEELNVKIDASKEVLGTLPTNNEKNINIYIDTLDELKEEFTKYENSILREMNSRVERMCRVKKDSELLSLEQEVSNVESILFLTNDIKTSYEKMGLDRAIHNLRYYYQKNLKVINETILYCLKKFKEVGINLRLEDFTYSKYVKDYLTSFFMGNDEVDIQKIQAKFKEIHWKCPNLITHIELNMRYLYLKNEKIIDKYYARKQVQLLGEVTPEDIMNRYMNLKRQVVEKTRLDKAIITDDLIEGKLNVKDFIDSAIEGRYVKFVSKEVYKDADDKALDEIDENIAQLFKSVYEYQMYLKYKFVINDVKNIYNEKDKYKNVTTQTKKEIAIKEKQILKMSDKLSTRGIKKTNDKLATEQDNLILEVKDLYRELDKNKVYDKIATELDETSTIKDTLYLAGSFYNYIFDCMMREYDKEISQESIEKDITELRNFMIWPYSTIITNIGMLEEKDILVIIKDRYQLLNINVSRQDLDQDNLEGLITLIKGIETSHGIRKNNIDVEEIGYIRDFKNILKDK